MPKQRKPFQAAIGKLILELDREYMRAVEDGQPLESIEAALAKAHTLLACGTPDDVRKTVGRLSLIRHFGSIWISSYPDVGEKISEAEKTLKIENGRESAS